MTNSSHQTEILGLVQTLVSLGELLYQDYLNNGKSKSRARLLRDNNERMRDHLLANTHRLDAELRPSALKLIHHCMCFVSQWDTYDSQNQVAEDQDFSYPTDVGFPREDVAKLLQKIKN